MAKFVKYGDKKIPVEDGLPLYEIKAIMARHFPELAQANVETKQDEEDMVYVFVKKAGQKGSVAVGARGAGRGMPMERVLRRLEKLKPCEYPPREVVAFCLGASEAVGENTRDQVFNVAIDLEKEADKVGEIAQRLWRLRPAGRPGGYVL